MKNEVLIVSNKSISMDLSQKPFFLEKITGIDGLKNTITTNKGIGQDGSNVTNKTIEQREIVITGNLVGDTKEEVQRNRLNLIKLFNPKDKFKLQYSYAGITREIDVEIDTAPIITKSRVWRYQQYTVTLLAPNPYLKDIYDTGDLISTWLGGWKFKFKLPFRFKQKGEPKKNIFNDGHVETPVEVIFKGPAVNPSIINRTTDEFIKIERTLTSDDTLYITTEFGNKKVEIERSGVRQNAFHYIDLDSTFFQLQVGDNMIEYTTDNELEPQSVEIRYRNRYLGI